MHFGNKWRGLRTRIIAWSFFPTLIILAAVAIVTYTAYQNVTKDLVVERDQELTRLSAGQIASEMKSFTDLLTVITRDASVSSGIPQFQGGALVRYRNRLGIFDGGVLILDNHGKTIAAQPPRPEIMNQDWSTRDYFREMVRAPKPVYSNILTDGPQNGEVIAIAVPILGDQGEFLGTLVGMFRIGVADVSAFYGGIVKQRIGEGGINYIVDSFGRVIYHVNPQRVGEDFSNQPVVQRVLTGQSGALRTRDYDGQAIVAGYANIPGTPWSLISEESWSTLIKSSRTYGQFLALLLVLGVIIPTMLVAVGVQRIMKPIESLISAAQEVARGNFNQSISAQAGDEIGELARQFNIMAEELRQSYAQLEQRVADRTKELAALNEIASEVSRTLDLQKVLDGALDKTLELTRMDSGGVYLWDEEAQVLKIVATKGYRLEFIQQIDHLKYGEGISGRVIEIGEPLVVSDISSDSRLTRTIARDEHLHSVASFPLIARGNVLGALFITTKEFRTFSEQEINLLSSIGHQIGVAVQNSQLFTDADHRMQELDALFRADEELLRHLSLEQVSQALVDVAVDIFRVDKSAFLIFDARRENLIYKAARGFSQETLDGYSFHIGQGIVGRVAQTGETMMVEDTEQDHLVARNLVEREGIRSCLHVPIKINEQVFGVFNVNFTHPHAFGREEQRLFTALTQRAALAIENAQLYEQAQYVATLEERQRLARELHDAVTQTLFSSSLIAEVLPILWERKPEEGRRRLEELRQLTRGALAEMRTLLLELRPSALMEAEIEELFRQLTEAFTGRLRIPIQKTIKGECRLSPEEKLAFYRIAQEALNNISKHSNASSVKIELNCNSEQIELLIEDDGCGFDLSQVSPQHLGLGIMRERAVKIGASLTVHSEAGHGTQVRAVIPASSRSST